MYCLILKPSIVIFDSHGYIYSQRGYIALSLSFLPFHWPPFYVSRIILFVLYKKIKYYMMNYYSRWGIQNELSLPDFFVTEFPATNNYILCNHHDKISNLESRLQILPSSLKIPDFLVCAFLAIMYKIGQNHKAFR